MNRLGRYEITRELGAGGHGTVYEAVLHGPGGLRLPVALKVLKRGDGLRREARIGGLLRHPNLVDVYEVGEVDGTWFCAMELCRGGALSERVPLPPRAVVEVGLAVCDALAYASRELGLVHLDLKPANLLVSGGTVKVADLGISRARGFEGARVVAGTPGFMAPEQRSGGVVDHRADLWALATTLAVLSTGRLPDRARTSAIDAWDESVTTDVVAAGAAPGEARDPALDWLTPVLDACLAWHPDDRPADFEAVAALLRGLGARGPGLASLLGAAEAGDAPAAAPHASPLVGRGALIDAGAEALERPGALVIQGPPGVGKSRLARELSATWARAGRPTFHVELVEARTPADVWQRVGRAVGVRADERVARERLATLGEALLVLDPFEHLAGHEGLLRDLAEAGPGLRVVAASRVPVDGADQGLVVPPLALDEAVALLRRKALERGVVADEDPALRDIAERLGGNPMLLELAAGRLGVLSPAEVRDRLGLSLLRTGRAGLSDREATFAGALDWSFQLLAPADQEALGDLSVFRGGFSLAAAEEVLSLGGRFVVDAIEGLVEAGLVHRLSADRFGMLEPVVEYAAARLAERPGAGAERRHGACFGAWGSDAEMARADVNSGWRTRAPDLDNLVVACERAVARGDGELGARLVRAVWSVAQRTGPVALPARLAEAVAASPDLPAAAEGRVCMVMGQAIRLGPRAEEALGWYGRALDAAVRAQDRRLQALVLGNRGMVGIERRLDSSEEDTRAGLAIFQELGDLRSQAMAWNTLAFIARKRDRLAVARERYQQAQALARRLGDDALLVHIQGGLVQVLKQEGRVAEGRVVAAEVVDGFLALGDTVNASVVRGALGELCALDGDREAALAHLTAARDALEGAGMSTLTVSIQEALAGLARGA